VEAGFPKRSGPKIKRPGAWSGSLQWEPIG
jgi:hypothetical protein